MEAICDSMEERVVVQRADQAERVESIEGIVEGGRSRSGEREDTSTVSLYGSRVQATRPAYIALITRSSSSRVVDKESADCSLG